MRNLAFLATLATLAACDGGLQFAHMSTLNQDVRGVALADGDYARVGMSGTTCDVDTDYGSIGTDYNYPGNEDTVHDVDQGKVVITSDAGVHILDRNPAASTEREDYDLPVASYPEAVAIDDGVVLIGETASGCGVHWAGRDLDASSVLKPEMCTTTPGLAADPTLGTAWLGTPDGIFTAEPLEGGGVTQLTEEPADLLVFDSSTELMYTAFRGDSDVRALDLLGDEVWSTIVEGTITDLAEFGDRGKVLVSVQQADGGGAVLVLDGLTGEFTNQLNTPDGNQEIVASEGGDQIALLRDNEVHFYEAYTWIPLNDLASIE